MKRKYATFVAIMLVLAHVAMAHALPAVCDRTPESGDTAESISLIVAKQLIAGCYEAEAIKIYNAAGTAAKTELISEGQIRRQDVAGAYFREALQYAQDNMGSNKKSYQVIKNSYERTIAALRGTPGMQVDNLNRDAWILFSDEHDEIPAMGQAAGKSLILQKEAADCMADDRCPDAYQHLKTIGQYALVGLNIISDYHKETIDNVVKDLGIRSTKWKGFFEDTVGQYPWELAANTIFYKKNWLGVDAQDEKGFSDPPLRQIILLHPGIGLDYVDEAPDGSQFKPILVMEWLGYNCWRYDAKGRLIYPGYISGISVISSFADREDVDDIRFGALVRIQSAYAIGLTTDGDGNSGVVVNIEFGNWWTEEAKPFIDSYIK